MTNFAVVALYLTLYFCLITFSNSRAHSSSDDEQCKAWLVQSKSLLTCPTSLQFLAFSLLPDVFRWLAGNSSESLDIVAQYWQLVAHPDDPRSGDYGYSKDDMRRFGANDGYQVYRALENAADRDISIRFLQHSGVYPDYTEEPSTLALGRPNVKNVTLLLKDWWGSGIVHAKVWISDSRDVYIGSANNDWKSLSQVSPLPKYVEVKHVNGYPMLSDPDMFHIIIDTPGRNCTRSQPQSSYLSFAPPEHQTDEQGWVDTIKSVGNGATVRISTMDWLSQSQFLSETVYWSSLSSAISEV
ncbi:hypothetical protein CASFOL_007325 [Castilleja foliolosa]|uniref:PLD phosphodiesterase domain-containing protein n=1 Tax=Castilleja foliolosa TaxID=1961234 RepID=A0ABD3E9G5_9LAMI